MHVRLVASLLVVLPLMVGSSAARAEAPAAGPHVREARQHFLDGKQAFERKDYAEALTQFEAGYALEPRAGFLLNMGHAARKMGQLRRARTYYKQFLLTEPAGDERRAAEKLVADIDREVTADPSLSPPRATPAALELAAVPVSASPAPESAGLIAAAGTPGSDPAAGQSEPLYRRWWFWAGAGSLAAGVATLLIIGAAHAGSGAHDNGTWGQLRL
jgi:hypothetical protein